MNNQVIIPECEKIAKKPLALFYNFFRVIKEESNINGYWKDKGKLYIDNIQKINVSIIHKDYLQSLIYQSFREGEKAVFYKDFNNYAIILDNKGQKITLKNQVHIRENKKPSDNYIKELLKNTEGLTIYELKENDYLIEIYK